jgi:hypothetical protein
MYYITFLSQLPSYFLIVIPIATSPEFSVLSFYFINAVNNLNRLNFIISPRSLLVSKIGILVYYPQNLIFKITLIQIRQILTTT